MSLISLDLAYEEEARVTTTGSERLVWYKAICSSVFDGDREILLGAPTFGVNLLPFSVDPKNPARVIAETYPKRIPGSAIFDVQVTYSTDVSFDTNPLAQPAQITITGQRRDVVALFDAYGRPKMNTAGDLLGDPSPTRRVTDLIFSVSKNVPLNLPAYLTDYLDTVNSDACRIRGLSLDPGTLLFCGEIKVGPEENTGPSQGNGVKQVPFTTVNFELHYHADGWRTFIANRGYFQLVPVQGSKFQGGKNVRILAPTDSGPQVVTVRKGGKIVPTFSYTRQRITVGDPPDYPAEPQFLDSNGALIENPTPDNIVILEFDDFDQRPFNQLPGIGRP